MILKKFNSDKTKSKFLNIRDLSNYIVDPKGSEKCIYSNGRNFIFSNTDHNVRTKEMIALAEESVRSKNPVDHLVLSWREGEFPSNEQVESCVDIILDEFGMQKHLCVYGLHQDTDNIHLHIELNRVDPDTLKCVEINRGFNRDANARAVARIEHAHGWQREKNGIYMVMEDGSLARCAGMEGEAKVGQRVADVEQRTGEKSATRIAIEEGAPIIKLSKSWSELHDGLGKKGMRYEKFGSGAKVFVSIDGTDVAIKASDVDRNASLSKLEKRLGPYAAPASVEVATRKSEPLYNNQPNWLEYSAMRKSYNEKRGAAQNEMKVRHKRERDFIFASLKHERDGLFSKRSWAGKGVERNALLSVIAAQHAGRRADLIEAQKMERDRLRKAFPPVASYGEFLRDRDAALEQSWRHKDFVVNEFKGEGDDRARVRDIRDFRAEIHGRDVEYSGAGGDVAFVDRGKRVSIKDTGDDSVLAALQLAQAKWPKGVEITGTDDFKQRCVGLAAERGIKITNPELQDRIKAERERLAEERRESMKTQQQRDFDRYSEAVGAERYRVTSIKMRQDGSKSVLILDKRNGETKGFERENVPIREMVRLQEKGENLYYTPLSRDKHHILIDDMNESSLARLKKDGYRPAVVLESSPGSYQCILNVPKNGVDAERDREVGNRLCEKLNKEYGDPKLSGVVHPHRAPGFENRKPKHQADDGTYPPVLLVSAEHIDCGAALRLSRQIDSEIAAKKVIKPAKPFVAPSTVEKGDSELERAYMRHADDVLAMNRKKSPGEVVDYSRVDSMVATRLRVTGRSREEVKGVIEVCAPKVRERDGAGRTDRDWSDYARRTSGYTFGPAGDRQVEKVEKYEQRWKKLEVEAVKPERQRPERQPPEPVRQPERERRRDDEREI